MKPKFKVAIIGQIAPKLRLYKTLHVTTRGQMFRKEAEADEAVRTLNMIIDDSNDYVGVLKMDESMVTDTKLREYGKDTTKFDKLFDDAKIPVSKVKKKEHKRKVEAPNPDEKETVDSVAAALGLNEAEVEDVEGVDDKKDVSDSSFKNPFKNL